jgi:hypothetical protein
MTRRRKRRILLFIGITSLLLATAVSFLWFYWLGPLRQFGHWIETPYTLSPREEWTRTKRRIRRTGWNHSDCITVGRYGDKEFAAEMIRRMKPGQYISSCWGGHKDEALRTMTNQDAGDTVKEWQEWWQANKHKTQQQWIREGFEQAGLTLHSPLTKQDITALLLIISRPGETPDYHWNNAFRWLRDNDFDPRSFTPYDLEGDDPDALLAGLIRYTQWGTRYPKGCLRAPEGALEVDWFLMKPWFVAGVYSLLAITFGGGILCLRLSTRKLKPQTDVEAGDSGE